MAVVQIKLPFFKILNQFIETYRRIVVDLDSKTRIDDHTVRIGNSSIYVDIVETSEGAVRIGSMPDISKYTRKYGIEEKYVIVPPWVSSQGGDNRTGEEFCFWCYDMGLKTPPLYIGLKKDLEQLYKNLDMIYSYYFDETRRKIVKTDWLDKYFRSRSIDKAPFTDGKLRIEYEGGKIKVYEGGNVIYQGVQEFINSGRFIDGYLSKIQQNKNRDFSITVVGNGNGFIGITSSFVVEADDFKIWIDPAAQPAITLGRVGINWDSITHLLITHNHEDHISGFTACLKRSIDKGKRLKLITATSVYNILVKQFKQLFPEIEDAVELIVFEPGKPLKLGNTLFTARWNHHIIPYGTLGIKIGYNGKCWGLSGDTKYKREIVEEIGREELFPEWFTDCNLIFHEVVFDNPNSVHTYYEDLLEFKKRIKGELLVYHTDEGSVREGFRIAEVGKKYFV